MIENTFIIPVIHNAYLPAMLDSLYEHAGHDFEVIIIDQCGLGYLEAANMYVVKAPRNLGFSKAMNLGMRMATTPYVTYANDDIVFMDERWWQGIKDTFGKADNMLAVNPLSPKEPGWGYGKDTPDWADREGEFLYPKGKNWRKPEDVDYDWLHTSYKKGWIDGVAGWCVTVDHERVQRFFDLEKDINPYRLWFDERFYPGSGEDYDLCHRAYGKGFKMVATCSSYVWHHWGKAQEKVKLDPSLVDDSLRWNKLNLLWQEDEVDGWRSPIFNKPHKRVDIVERVGL